MEAVSQISALQNQTESQNNIILKIEGALNESESQISELQRCLNEEKNNTNNAIESKKRESLAFEQREHQINESLFKL